MLIKLSAILIAMLSFPALAENDGVLVFSFGEGDVKEEDVRPARIRDFDQMRAFAITGEAGGTVAAQFGLRHANDDSTQIDFVNNSGVAEGYRRGQIFLSTIQLGLKIRAPYMISPYIGGGVQWGWLAVSDPTNRKSHSMTAAFGRETSYARGLYAQAGIDIMFGPHFGLRAGYQHDIIESERFRNLGKTGLKWEMGVATVGLVVRPE